MNNEEMVDAIQANGVEMKALVAQGLEYAGATGAYQTRAEVEQTIAQHIAFLGEMAAMPDAPRYCPMLTVDGTWRLGRFLTPKAARQARRLGQKS